MSLGNRIKRIWNEVRVQAPSKKYIADSIIEPLTIFSLPNIAAIIGLSYITGKIDSSPFLSQHNIIKTLTNISVYGSALYGLIKANKYILKAGYKRFKKNARDYIDRKKSNALGMLKTPFLLASLIASVVGLFNTKNINNKINELSSNIRDKMKNTYITQENEEEPEETKQEPESEKQSVGKITKETTQTTTEETRKQLKTENNLEARIKRVNEEIDENIDELSEYNVINIKDDINNRILYWMKNKFIRDKIKVMINRVWFYRDIIEREADKYDNITFEFIMANKIVESEGEPRARSFKLVNGKKKYIAYGMDQMTKRFARDLGLIVNKYIDERYDPEKSTEASTREMSNYIREHGVVLAIAKYNGGNGSISRIKSRNWRVVKRVLKRYKNPNDGPTIADHVIKVLAMMKIIENMDKYGFEPKQGITYTDLKQSSFIHTVRKKETLNSIARKYGVNIKTLKILNLRLRNYNNIPVGYKLLVPTRDASEKAYKLIVKR